MEEGRRFLGCELNPEYGVLAEQRISPAFQKSIFAFEV
jgi:DNA modification methylase